MIEVLGLRPQEASRLAGALGVLRSPCLVAGKCTLQVMQPLRDIWRVGERT